jgi:diguanylate cyclase (GGDEF)-like protein
MAERLRRAFAAIDAGESGHRFRISASFGIADTDTAGYDLQMLMRQADAAMYHAKDAGRDRVETFATARPAETG